MEQYMAPDHMHADQGRVLKPLKFMRQMMYGDAGRHLHILGRRMAAASQDMQPLKIVLRSRRGQGGAQPPSPLRRPDVGLVFAGEPALPHIGVRRGLHGARHRMHQFKLPDTHLKGAKDRTEPGQDRALVSTASASAGQ